MFGKIIAGRHGAGEPGCPERAGFAVVVAAVAADLFCGIRVIAGVYGICGMGGFFYVTLHASVVVAVSAFFGHSGVPPLGFGYSLRFGHGLGRPCYWGCFFDRGMGRDAHATSFSYRCFNI
jgi:hypothetical protein